MKETQDHSEAKAPTEQIDQSKINKAKKLLGRITLKPGLKIWELNYLTGQLRVADIKVTKNVIITGRKGSAATREHISKEIQCNESCCYVPALNADNAVRKFNKIFGYEVATLNKSPKKTV